MTPTEGRYTQIDKEALAFTWECEHLADYLVGLTFHIQTDHKSLVPLFSTKYLEELPVRVQRFRPDAHDEIQLLDQPCTRQGTDNCRYTFSSTCVYSYSHRSTVAIRGNLLRQLGSGQPPRNGETSEGDKRAPGE